MTDGACSSGKLWFASKAIAKRHLSRARSMSGRGRVHAYRCKECGGFHLGGRKVGRGGGP